MTTEVIELMEGIVVGFALGVFIRQLLIPVWVRSHRGR
jgi:hypothetical protein